MAVDDLPAYMTDPAEALGERAVWQRRFERRIADALREEQRTSLTAAATHPGGRLSERQIRNILTHLPELPDWAHNHLRHLTIEPDVTMAQIARDLARDLATAAYNEHVLRNLAIHGYRYKQWVTRHDDRVRPAHRHTDGSRAPLSRPFVMEGSLLQYPQDFRTAPPHLTVNCRCCIVGRKTARKRS